MTDEHSPTREDAASFPVPPIAFTDGGGHRVTIEPFRAPDDDGFEALVAMYVDFDSSMRAQGIPPVGERRVRAWLSTLVEAGSYNLVAWVGGRAIGHATLVPDGEDHELAIFVHQDYQGRGVGTRLIRALLGYGAANGVEAVWLTVERWNDSAVALYEKVGLETTNSEALELEMELDLSGAQTESTG